MDLIEFMFVLPFLLFFMLFTFDIGRVSLASGILHDAANQAARAGAQAGGGCINLTTGGASGSCTETSGAAVSVRTFTESLRGKPILQPSEGKVTVVRGGVCTSSATSDHVVVEARYELPMFTPGLGALIGITTGEPWQLTAGAVSRCEVVRG